MSLSVRARLDALLRERILILDGGMGTMIQQHRLDEAAYRGERFADWASDLKGNNDLLCITQPAIIEDIHRAYLDAGADIIETNSFNATRIAMADYAMEDLARELNVAAAQCARRAVDAAMKADPARPRFVAGVLGPTNRTASISPDVNDPGYRNTSFDLLVDAYLEAIDGVFKDLAAALAVENVAGRLRGPVAHTGFRRLTG